MGQKAPEEVVANLLKGTPSKHRAGNDRMAENLGAESTGDRTRIRPHAVRHRHPVIRMRVTEAVDSETLTDSSIRSPSRAWTWEPSPATTRAFSFSGSPNLRSTNRSLSFFRPGRPEAARSPRGRIQSPSRHFLTVNGKGNFPLSKMRVPTGCFKAMPGFPASTLIRNDTPSRNSPLGPPRQVHRFPEPIPVDGNHQLPGGRDQNSVLRPEYLSAAGFSFPEQPAQISQVRQGKGIRFQQTVQGIFPMLFSEPTDVDPGAGLTVRDKRSSRRASAKSSAIAWTCRRCRMSRSRASK